jgi:hypothetical protein
MNENIFWTIEFQDVVFELLDYLLSSSSYLNRISFGIIFG